MNNRLDRVNAEIKREVSIIINNKLRDPQITDLISVTDCEVSPDLSSCKVFISAFGNMDKQELLNRIKGAGGFIRKELAHSIRLRVTPRLEFFLDNSIDYGKKIDDMLKNIKYSSDDFKDNN